MIQDVERCCSILLWRYIKTCLLPTCICDGFASTGARIDIFSGNFYAVKHNTHILWLIFSPYGDAIYLSIRNCQYPFFVTFEYANGAEINTVKWRRDYEQKSPHQHSNSDRFHREWAARKLGIKTVHTLTYRTKLCWVHFVIKSYFLNFRNHFHRN